MAKRPGFSAFLMKSFLAKKFTLAQPNKVFSEQDSSVTELLLDSQAFKWAMKLLFSSATIEDAD
jgi:hypothetical protein